MSRSSSKRVDSRLQKKQVEAKLKLQGNPGQGGPLEVAHLRALEADLTNLGEAFNKNSEVFSHSLMVIEMRMRVVERTQHDMIRGTLRTIEVDGLKYIDFQSYVAEFGLCMLVSELATWLHGLHMAHNGKESGQILTPQAYAQDQENVTIFGG